MILDKPWGRVTTYTLNQPASVRIIEVQPGQQTSLQYHNLRDELWVILDPGLKVQIGEDVTDAQPATSSWCRRSARTGSSRRALRDAFSSRVRLHHRR